jgi:hypothetical protein
MKGHVTKARMEIGILLAVVTVGVVGLTALSATAGEEKARTRDVTLTGKITDLHSYMTAQSPADEDVTVVRKRFRGGVPVILQTEEGPVVLGQGEKRPGAVIMRHVLQRVQVKGKLYEKQGMQYLDIDVASVTAVAAEEKAADEEVEEEGVKEDDDEEEEEGETEWEESEDD